MSLALAFSVRVVGSGRRPDGASSLAGPGSVEPQHRHRAVVGTIHNATGFDFAPVRTGVLTAATAVDFRGRTRRRNTLSAVIAESGTADAINPGRGLTGQPGGGSDEYGTSRVGTHASKTIAGSGAPGDYGPASVIDGSRREKRHQSGVGLSRRE